MDHELYQKNLLCLIGPHQLVRLALLLLKVQVSLALLQLLDQLPPPLLQFLLGDRQRLVAMNQRHDRRLVPIVQVTCGYGFTQYNNITRKSDVNKWSSITDESTHFQGDSPAVSSSSPRRFCIWPLCLLIPVAYMERGMANRKHYPTGVISCYMEVDFRGLT